MSEKPSENCRRATPEEIQTMLAEGLRDGTFRNLRGNSLFDIYEGDDTQHANLQALSIAVRAALQGLTPGTKAHNKTTALAAQIRRYKDAWMQQVQEDATALLEDAQEETDGVEREIDLLEQTAADLNLMLNRVTGRARLN